MEVIVLAGGLGTRLRSVVHEIPKCLAPIGLRTDASCCLRRSFPSEAKMMADASFGEGRSCGQRPFLGYLLDWLIGEGVNHVVFSVGYLKEQVISYVEGKEWPFSYDFAVEETPLGTGGGIRKALGYCREDKVYVVNGDTFYPVALSAMPFERPVTLALKPMKDFERYGTVEVRSLVANAPQDDNYSDLLCHSERSEESIVTAFHEKKHCAEGLINGGIYTIDRTRLDMGSLPEKFSFEKDVLEPGAAIDQIGGWVSDAYFIDIGVPEDYELAQWAIPAWEAVQAASKAVLQTSADTLFLDRDGVLNRHLPGNYVKNWAQWQWMPGILQELPRWAARFRHIILVSNQRGVGKGLMTDADLSRIHAQMMSELLEAGGRMDLILTCTAVSEDDPRRKPHTGMFREACDLFPDIEATRSVMLGDSPSDAAFAQNCGMSFILLEDSSLRSE